MIKGFGKAPPPGSSDARIEIWWGSSRATGDDFTAFSEVTGDATK
jgi:hypothetical protein